MVGERQIKAGTKIVEYSVTIHSSYRKNGKVMRHSREVMINDFLIGDKKRNLHQGTERK